MPKVAEELMAGKGIRPGGAAGIPVNGSSGKRVLNDIGAVEVDVPQDRNGEFTPQIVPKGARRLSGSRWPPRWSR